MTSRVCSAPECPNPSHARGLCSKHYMRVWTAEKAALRPPPPTPKELFWAKVDRRGVGDCWMWQAQIDKHGYGRVWNRAWSTTRAHRVAYELLVGPIPDGLVTDHLCRNRACVNPSHLELVTPKENTMRGQSPTIVAAREDTCLRGHSLLDAHLRSDGTRWCRTCTSDRKATTNGTSVHSENGDGLSPSEAPAPAGISEGERDRAVSASTATTAVTTTDK